MINIEKEIIRDINQRIDSQQKKGQKVTREDIPSIFDAIIKKQLFDPTPYSEEDYKSGKASFHTKVEALNGQEIAVFENLPDGEYAIKMYQDENDNNKMDFNMMGIPKEGYGFSNNVGMFGSPEYTEAKFSVKESTAIEIDLL